MKGKAAASRSRTRCVDGSGGPAAWHRPEHVAPRRLLHCHDNAVAESFHDKLKRELISRGTWPTRQTEISGSVEYVERFCNARRMHSTLNYRSPSQFEQQIAAPETVAV